jgi:hypothetical protein
MLVPFWTKSAEVRSAQGPTQPAPIGGLNES